jgi:hypothetical protein
MEEEEKFLCGKHIQTFRLSLENCGLWKREELEEEEGKHYPSIDMNLVVRKYVLGKISLALNYRFVVFVVP